MEVDRNQKLRECAPNVQSLLPEQNTDNIQPHGDITVLREANKKTKSYNLSLELYLLLS